MFGKSKFEKKYNVNQQIGTYRGITGSWFDMVV